MAGGAYESSLNTWLAGLLRDEGLAAQPEAMQAGGKRLDVAVELAGVKIALEAERGFDKGKLASAIKDADGRLRDGLADCAVAICYAEGIRWKGDLADSELMYCVRTYKDRPPPNKTVWQRATIAQLVSVIRKLPDELGDPDNIAHFLSGSLDRAVARLSESQKKDLAQNLDLPQGAPIEMQFGDTGTSRYNQAAKRAMLVIATAIMFHSQLDRHRHDITPHWDQRTSPLRRYEGSWPPETAGKCAEDRDPVGAFSSAWNQWLAVDYKPIFATARNALLGLAQDSRFSAAVHSVALAALLVTRNIVGLRHDLLGRIFHRVLETARFDGSFYTTTAAATLLATLAIRDDMCDWTNPDAIARLRITDPACGTGTLLMAAAERIRDLTRAAHDKLEVSQILIEQVLTGYDVNLTATHLAATTLGLLSPTTTFRNMKIRRAFLGVDKDKAYLGSLEFLSPDQLPKIMPWPTGMKELEDEEEVSEAEQSDLVIMNPPFTRDSLRHDQFGKEEEKELKSREKELFWGQPIHLSSNGNAFLVLAEHIAEDGNGALAAVLPLVTATNTSSREIREFLAERFHVEVILTSHDPRRLYFSENTSISEMLLLCRRWSGSVDKPATRVINLYENPATPAAAVSVARDIAEDNTRVILGTVQRWSSERIAQGDWGAVQFLSPYLCEMYFKLRQGHLFGARNLGRFALIGPAGQGVRGIFNPSLVSDTKGMTALWHHKTERIQKMAAETDTYIMAKKGRETQAIDYWNKRGTLLLAARARLNTVRAVSVRLPQPALGSAWVPCKPIGNYENLDIDKVERAICAYLNSTIGVLALVGNRSIKHLSYSQFSMDDLRKIPVPDFPAMDKSQVTALATAYDSLRNMVLKPLPQMEECETRQALDRVVADALGLKAEILSQIRRELSREPSITGRRYNET